MAKKTAKKPETDYVSELSISSGKQPPNAFEFERLILGTAMIDRIGVEKAVKVLGGTTDVFYDPRHAIIWNAILDLRKKDYPVDLSTVIQELKRTEKLGLGGGDHYIIDLTMGVSSSAHLDYHCFIVLEKYFRRKMINDCARVIAECYTESSDTFDIHETLREAVEKIDEIVASKKDSISAKTAHLELMQGINDKKAVGVSTGYRSLDDKGLNFKYGNLVVIAGRTGMGKSAVTLNFVKNFAYSGIPSAYFSLEMPELELHERLIANALDVSFYRLNNRKLTDEEKIRLIDRAGEIEDLPLYYDTTQKLNEIVGKIRFLVRERGVKVVAVDYLQQVDTDTNNIRLREQEVALISKTLKRLALQLNILIFAPAQLSRSVEQRPIKRPQMSDLRESGAIEMDADIVMLLYRPEYYKVDTWDREWDGIKGLKTDSEVEIQVAKFRNGTPFEERAKFWGDRQRIVDISDTSMDFNNPVPFQTKIGGNDNDWVGSDDFDLDK